jgi:hypothetical protein
MSRGELLTRATIWAALAGYTCGVAAFILSRKRQSWDRAARLAWTIGCVCLLAHAVCAFHFYHGWSQTAAYRETARQTAEVFGFNWGGGLYINYALIAGWMLDVLWWWRSLDAYRSRPRLLAAAWQGFLIFIFFNATVVFETGPLRLIGLSVCLALCLLWWRASASKSSHKLDKHREMLAKD